MRRRGDPGKGAGTVRIVAASSGYERTRQRHLTRFNELLPGQVAAIDWSEERLRTAQDERTPVRIICTKSQVGVPPGDQRILERRRQPCNIRSEPFGDLA